MTLPWGDVVAATRPSVPRIEAVADGIQEMVTEGAAYFGTRLPTIPVVGAPCIWRDPAHLTAATNGPIGQEFDEQLEKARGMRILGTTDYCTRHLTTSREKVRTVADMAGFRDADPKVVPQRFEARWGKGTGEPIRAIR